MRTFLTPSELQAAMHGPRSTGESIAIVPTMGHLHDGHISLVELAKQRADRVIVTIFVNPLQFNQSADLQSYPQTPREDASRLAQAGVDWLFTPNIQDIYPAGMDVSTQVEVPQISEELEGASRPGHFSGVATIVAKLFNIVQPDIAVFGEKDFQQLRVIRKMVDDLNFPLRIMSGPTVREEDGLAMSSRNSLLTSENRARAPKLHRLLVKIAEVMQSGARNFSDLEKNGMDLLVKAGFQPDYISIRGVHSFKPATLEDSELVILAAASLGSVRLIDNLPVSLKKAS